VVDRKARNSYLLRTHGITLDEYEQLLAYQGGHCAVCPATGGSRSLHVDHDHKKGLIRGLLCFFHNALLMRRGVSPELLREAADYLESPPAVQLFGERTGTVGPIKPRRRRRRKRK